MIDVYKATGGGWINKADTLTSTVGEH